MADVPWHEGDVIRKLRTIYGWTLDDLEERCDGVSFTTINKIELGKTKDPKRHTLDRIARAFGWTVRQLHDAIPQQPIAVSADIFTVAQEQRRLAPRARVRTTPTRTRTAKR